MKIRTRFTEIKIKQMIQKFLIEKQMSKEKLANALITDVKTINNLFSQKISPELISRIELPLIKLYCRTKWA